MTTPHPNPYLMKDPNHHSLVRICIKPLRPILLSQEIIRNWDYVKGIAIPTTTVPKGFTASISIPKSRMSPGVVDTTTVEQIIASQNLRVYQPHREIPVFQNKNFRFYLFSKRILQIFPICRSSDVREIVIAILIVMRDLSALKDHHIEQQYQVVLE
jgi:hypothetical protein